MYKRHLTTILLASIFLIPIAMGAGLISPYNTHMVMETGSSGLANIPARIADQGNSPFSINMFNNKSVINVNRTIAINDYGSAVLTDSISISNITNTFNSFNLSFASDVAANVHYGTISAKSDNQSLSVTLGNPSTSNITGIVTYPIILGNSVNQVQITLTFSLTDLITNNKATLGSATDNLLPYHFQADLFYPWYSIPITKYIFSGGTNALFSTQSIKNDTFLPNAGNIGATTSSNFNDPHRFRIYTLDQLNTINYTILAEKYGYNVNLTTAKKFIPAFSPNFELNMTQKVSFDFYLDTMMIEYTNVESVITIDSWSSMYRTETVTIKNVGVGGNPSGSSQGALSNGVYRFRFFIPVPLNQISDVSVSDALGNLTQSRISYGQINLGYSLNLTLISVAPRINIPPNHTYTVTLNYKIDNSAVMSETSGFFSQAWNVSTSIMSMYNWTVRHMTVRIVFPLFSNFQISSTNAWNPESVAYSSTTTNAFIGFLLPRPQVVLTFENASYIENKVITVHYSLLPIIGWFVEPSIFMFFFFMLGLIYVFIRVLTIRISPVVSSEPSKEEIPYDLIEGFVRFYQEKTAYERV